MRTTHTISVAAFVVMAFVAPGCGDGTDVSTAEEVAAVTSSSPSTSVPDSTSVSTSSPPTSEPIDTTAPLSDGAGQTQGPGVHIRLVDAKPSDCSGLSPCYWVVGKVIGYPNIRSFQCIINDTPIQGGTVNGSSWGPGLCKVVGKPGTKVQAAVEFVTPVPDPAIGCCMKSNIITIKAPTTTEVSFKIWLTGPSAGPGCEDICYWVNGELKGMPYAWRVDIIFGGTALCARIGSPLTTFDGCPIASRYGGTMVYALLPEGTRSNTVLIPTLPPEFTTTTTPETTPTTPETTPTTPETTPTTTPTSA